AVVPRDAAQASALPVTYERRDQLHLERSTGLSRAVYLIACASDRPIAELPGPSFYIDTTNINETETALNAAQSELAKTTAELAVAPADAAAARIETEAELAEAERVKVDATDGRAEA